MLLSSSADDVSIPTLPVDVISEILYRLSVKSLLQFRCVSKSWKSLISDPIFARNHLNHSPPPPSKLRRQTIVHVYSKYSLQSIFTTYTTDYNNLTRFQFPPDNNICQGTVSHCYYIVGSCDGILCIANYNCFVDFKPLVILWNPSIIKFKELPPFENSPEVKRLDMSYAFGYDHVSHDYKVIVIYSPISNTGTVLDTTKAKVYTLNTDSWRTIQPFPFDYVADCRLQGRYLSGSNSINWMAFSKLTRQNCIISFDLGNESYQMISLPPVVLERTPGSSRFCVLRDWLCVIFDHDVWVMKEYGIQDSWTKLFNVTHLLDPPYKTFTLINVLYLFQDDQLLLLFQKVCERVLILYNYKNDCLDRASSNLHHLSRMRGNSHTSKVSCMLNCIPEVCVESLISPCL